VELHVTHCDVVAPCGVSLVSVTVTVTDRFDRSYATRFGTESSCATALAV
jgi:hypothetical protein